MAHNFRPKRHRFFFAYVKSQKYANFKMLKNTGPELNLESYKMGHLVLLGQSDSEIFGLVKLAGNAVFIIFPTVPPISKMFELMFEFSANR